MPRLLRPLAILVLVLGGPQLLTAPPAEAADDAYLTTPMTGTLPVCQSDMFTASGNMDVFANSPVGGDTPAINQSRALGLKNNCANMNWQQPGNSAVIEQAMNAYAVPDTFSINNTTQTVVFHADAVSAPGPLNADFPDCMPRSTRAGGCTSPGLRLFVAYRLANGAGQFLGKWTLAGTSGNPNPYFDLTRQSCPDNYGNWDPGYPHTGAPCAYALNFVTDANGKPNLTTAMQVAVAIDGVSGTETANGTTGYKYSSAGIASMVFMPGSSTSLELGASAATVPYGKPVTLSATATGPAPGAQVGFYSQVLGGTPALVGTAATGVDGRATLATTVKQSASYYAALLNGGVQTVKTDPVGVLVGPSLKLKVKHDGGARYEFTGKVLPDVDGIQVQLQKLVGKKWKKAGKGKTKNGKVTISASVPDGTTTYRLRVAGSATYAASESKTRSVTRRPAIR